MGTLSLKQSKDRIYSTAIHMQQLKSVLNYTTMDDERRSLSLTLIESLTEGMAAFLTMLPDQLELNRDVSDIPSVVVVKDKEEAKKVMAQHLGEMPKDGESIH